MIDQFQKFSRSWFVKIILALIITVFAFWGVGNLNFFRVNVLASINGQAIYLNDFNTFYQSLLNERQQSGENFNEEELAVLRVNALDIMINRIVYQQQAEQYGFRVTDYELADIISRVPDFQTEERFDQRKYLAYLDTIGSSPSKAEKKQRADLTIRKLDILMQNAVAVNDKESALFYTLLNKKHKADIVFLNPDLFKDNIKISEKELLESYEANKAKLKSPPKFDLEYITLTASDFVNKISIRESEIENYYRVNLEEEFTGKPGFLSKHILIAFENESKKEAKRALAQAKKIYKEVINKPDRFSEIAEKKSNDTFSAKDGGSLGWVENGQLVPEFEEAIKNMKIGTISKPIKSVFGYHIIQLNDVREEAIVQELDDELKTSIKETLLLQTAQVRLDKFILRNEVSLSNRSLDSIAQKYKKTIEKIEQFQGSDENIPRSQQFYSKISNQNLLTNFVYKVEEQYLVYRLLAKQVGKQLSFEEAQESIKRNLSQSLGKLELQKQLDDIKANIKTKANFDAFIKKYDLKDAIYPIQFALTDADDKVLLPAPLKNKIAKIKTVETVTVIEENQAAYLIYKSKPDDTKLDAANETQTDGIKRQIENGLRVERYNIALQKLIQSLRNNAEITYYPDELQLAQIEI